MSLLYLGSFDDVLPIKYFHDVKTFIYVDQCPENTNGCFGFYDNVSCPVFVFDLYQKFLENLERAGISFSKHTMKNNKWSIFLDDGRVIYYYVNTCFPNKDIQYEIETAQILYISGWHPPITELHNLKYLEKIFVGRDDCLHRHKNTILYDDDDVPQINGDLKKLNKDIIFMPRYCSTAAY
jgi:hypothetical protein